MTNKMNKLEAQAYFRETAPKYDEATGSWTEATSELEEELRKSSIAAIDLGLDPNAFQELSDQYGRCVEHFSTELNGTAGSRDVEGVPEDGHVRKNIAFNPAGMQITDPKELFHFNNTLRERWEAGEFRTSKTPAELREFMDNGFDLHEQLARQARVVVETLDESYGGRMSELYFPTSHPLGSVTFRLLRYDGYRIYDESGRQIALDGDQVAKPHYDRGGMTIQAYSSAPGFWVQPEPTDRNAKRKPTDPIIFPPHGSGQSQVFFGKEHHMIYGKEDAIQNLHHGVDRVVDGEAVDGFMPVRTAAIAFVDSPIADLHVTSKDTQPDRVDQDKLIV